MGSGQDVDLEQKFERRFGKKNNEIPDADIFYIYRWAGTQSYHLSGFGKDKENQKPGNTKVEEYVRRQIGDGSLLSGEVELHPHWKLDYKELASSLLSSTGEAAKL